MGKGKQAAKQASSSGRSKITGGKKQGECEKESTEGGGDGGMEERPTKVVGRDAKRSSTNEASDATSSLDAQLEATAKRKNLSVTNVKSILHHLVKDQRVLKLVQRLAKEGEEGGSTQQASDDWDELTAYLLRRRKRGELCGVFPSQEPRLTRSRVQKAVMSAVAAGSLSADKTALLKTSMSTKTSVGDVQGPSTSSIVDDTESSDEEYNPDMSSGDEEEEEEEEEKEEEVEVNNNEDEVEDGVGGETYQVESEGGVARRIHSLMEDENVPTLPDPIFTSIAATHTATIFSTNTSASSVPITSTMSAHPLSASSTSTLSNALPSLTSTLPTPAAAVQTPTVPSSVQTESSNVSTLALPLISTEDMPTSTSFASHTPSPALLTSDLSVQQDLVIQEAAALLASMAESHTLSPLKLLSQQPTHSDVSIDHVSGISTDPANNVPGISGISKLSSASSHHTAAAREEADGTDEEIAQRTRSKHPLHDVSITSLEAGLGPVEGEDPPTPRELDPDELWWHQWLNSLTTDTLNDSQAFHTTEEEEEEDGEYNFLADSLRVEEREEFRNDRAVRIPRKEVDDLITELLNPSIEGSGGLLLSSDGLDLTGAYLLETLGVQIPALSQVPNETALLPAPQLSMTDDPACTSPSSSECYLSREQTVQLRTQIQQHFQLIMQTFVLARFEPSLVFVSQVAAQALDELSRWCSSGKDSEGGQSLWHIPDLRDGLDLVKTLDPYDDNAVKVTPSAGTPPKVPDGAQHVFMDNMLFWNYPQFLPASGFTPLTTTSASVTKYFTPEEERLLVLGMEHYGSSAWEEIQRNILPTKTLKQLKLRVKNRCSKRSGSNVIKEYKRTKKIPKSGDDMQSELPSWILAQEKRLIASREREEVQKKHKIEEVTKILTSASRAANRTSEHAERALCRKRDSTGTPTQCSSMVTSDSMADTTSTTQSVAGASSRVSVAPGNKRNLSDCVSSVHKRPCVSGGRSSQRKTLRLTSTQNSRSVVEGVIECSSRASLEHLLAVAGVEASDSMARFSFSFLREVKNVVSDSDPRVYQQFIQLLQQHCQHEWRPSQLYKEVSHLFESWPHLVSLFTEFLSPQDCLEANVLGEKHDVQNVKSFISKLQAQFSSAPLRIKEITDKLNQLDTPSVTRRQAYDSVLPLIEVHQELVEELRRFVFHLAPAPREDDVFEEVTLDGYEKQELMNLLHGNKFSPWEDFFVNPFGSVLTNYQPDGFEQVTLLGCHSCCTNNLRDAGGNNIRATNSF